MGCGASRAVIEVAITPGYENASTSSAKAAGEVASTPPSFTAAELAAKAAPTVEPESPVTTNSSSKRPEGSANAPSASPDSAAPSGPTPATQGPRPPASHRTQSLPHSASQPPSPPPSQPIRSSQSSRIFPKLPTSPGPAHPQPAALSPACPTLLTPLAKPRQGSCSNLPPLDVHPAPPPAHESQPAKSVSVSPHRISRLSTPTNHQPVTESGTGDLEEVLGRLPHALRAFWKGEFGSEDGASTERFCDAVLKACDGQVPQLLELVGNRAVQLGCAWAPGSSGDGNSRSSGSGGGAGEGGAKAADSAAGPAHHPDAPQLRHLLRSLMDPGGSGSVHLEDYGVLYDICCTWAVSDGTPQPHDLPSCLHLLASHFEPRHLPPPSDADQLRRLRATLCPADTPTHASQLLIHMAPGSRDWVLQEYLSWLGKGPSDPHRALVLYGGPGTGKSTVAAALVAKGVLFRAAGGGGAEAAEVNGDCGGAGGGEAVASCVAGGYFCSQDHDESSDPCVLVRSLAYSLAAALPCLRPPLLRLAGEEVRSLRGGEEALTRLLLEPMAEAQEQLAAVSQPVVLVIDGLDQGAGAGAGDAAAESTWAGAGPAAAADQAAGAADGAAKGTWAGAAGTAGVEGDEAGLGGSGGGAAAVGLNPLLILVKKLCAHLPPAVRLVLTARPLPHIRAALDSSLRPALIHLDSPDPPATASSNSDAVTDQHGSLRRRDVEQAVRHGLERLGLGAVEPGAPGAGCGAQGHSGGVRSRMEGEQQQGELLRVLVDKSGGNMACAMRWLDVLRARPDVSAAELAAMAPGLPGAYSCLLQRLGGPCNTASSGSSSSSSGGNCTATSDWVPEPLHRLLQVVVAAQEPLCLPLLVAAWRACGEGSGGSSSSSSSSACNALIARFGAPKAGMTNGRDSRGSCGMKLGPEEAVREVKRLLAQLGPLYTIRRGRVCPRDPHLHAYLRFSHHGTSTPSVPRIDPKPGHAALAAVAIPLASLTAAATAAVHRTAGVVHPLVPASQAVGRLLSARDAEACKAAAAAAVADPWVTTCTDDDRRAAESYAVRHVVQHLVAVANDCSGSSAAAAVVARGLLDGLLCDFDFLAAVFRSGRGRALVRELSALEAPLSEVVQDAVRWLLSCYRELCFASEAADVVATGLRCPMGTLAFRRAEGWALARAAAAGRRGWRLRHGLGALHGWPAVRLTLAGHGWAVNGVAWSTDGRCLASASDDATVRLWDPVTGECTGTLQGHDGYVTSVAWSPDGSCLATGGADESVRLWDVASGECVATLQGHTGRVKCVAWRSGGVSGSSGTGSCLASGGEDAVVRVWCCAAAADPSSASGAAAGGATWTASVMQGHAARVSCVAWSPDGLLLASASDDECVRLWDAASGECTATLQGHTSIVTGVAWSPDGNMVASASDDKTVRLWDVGRRQCTATLQGHVSTVLGVAWSPDGRSLASASYDKTLRLWTVTGSSSNGSGDCSSNGGSDNSSNSSGSGRCTAVLKGHERGVSAVAWSPDGRLLASGGYDEAVLLWDPRGDGERQSGEQGHMSNVSSVAWSPDGRRLASASDDRTLRLWDAVSGECTATLQGHAGCVTCVAWSPDSQSLATVSGQEGVWLWDAASGQRTAALQLQGQHQAGSVAGVAWSPDGRRLATGSADACVRVWEAGSGTCTATLQGHQKAVSCVAWSPDGRRLASASDDECVRLWDVANGKCTATLQHEQWEYSYGGNGVRAVAWSPDGSCLATGGEDECVRLWDVPSGECVATLQGHSCEVRSLSWHPGGGLLASACLISARVWDVALARKQDKDGATANECDKDTGKGAAGECIARLQGHTSVAWSPDGGCVAAASDEMSVRVWETVGGRT